MPHDDLHRISLNQPAPRAKRAHTRSRRGSSKLSGVQEVSYDIRPLRTDERAWLGELLAERWGGELIVGRGLVWRLDELSALVAFDVNERVGVATYTIDRDRAQLVTLDALREGAGVGRALIEAVVQAAQDHGAAELLVMTTNDNLRALKLYQRAGFALHELRPGAIEQARRVKPSIPQRGHDGIPVRDEIDLIRRLKP
jgi:GNAT superfamily N-acetyltransferase